MMEILQAEIVAYSSLKEIFVNGPPYQYSARLRLFRYKLIDTAEKRRIARWTRFFEDAGCGKAEGACAKFRIGDSLLKTPALLFILCALNCGVPLASASR
jgi:hypothetical protein